MLNVENFMILQGNRKIKQQCLLACILAIKYMSHIEVS